MEAVLRDFRHALVSLGRARGFSAAAILTLALGSGASSRAGARPWSIRRLVLQEGALVTAGGLAIGLTLAPVATQVFNAALFGVGPTDVKAYLAAGGILAMATVAACLVPARRATQSDPMRVLRTE